MSVAMAFPRTASPETALLLLSVVCGFVLKITAGYALCWLVARFATSASVRFLIWLTFLLSTAAFWIYCLGKVLVEQWASPVQAILRGGFSSNLTVTLSLRTAQTAGRSLMLAAAVYIAILLWMSLAGAWRRIQLTRALRYRTRPSSSVMEVFQRVADEIQVPSCELWLLTGLTSPASLGWASPAIYLPAEELETSTELHDVLWHELSHVRRRDGLWELLSRFCRCVVFFHPLVHRAFSSLRLEREVACDMLVVGRNPEKRDDYANTLVRFGWKTSLVSRPDRVGIGFTSQAAVLNARVRFILEGEHVCSKWSAGLRTLLGTGVCWLFAAIAPALWIGFGLSPVSASVRTGVPSVSGKSTQPLRRSGRGRLGGGAQTAQIVPITQITYPSENMREELQASRTNSQNHGFHVQNEDEPMSNPIIDSEASSAQEPRSPTGSKLPGKPGMPSATSMAIDTAVQLGRAGIGRGRDHDHD